MNRRITFTVTDTLTGEYPDLQKIALEEDWAKGLIYCDMAGFLLDEEGLLYLADDCDNVAYCPQDRFRVTLLSTRECDLAQGEPNLYEMQTSDVWHCGNCGNVFYFDPNIEGFESAEDVATDGERFCTYCGMKITGLVYHPENDIVGEEAP